MGTGIKSNFGVLSQRIRYIDIHSVEISEGWFSADFTFRKYAGEFILTGYFSRADSQFVLEQSRIDKS